MSGVLYVVATPIGNLGDLTLRAIETLKSCDRVAAEDTRHTRALLQHLGIGGKPLDALHAHSSERDVLRLLSALEAGESIALVTDAGTPLVSDPGAALVELAVEKGIRAVPIPGASAVTAALAASGLAGDGRHRFFGFLPREGKRRRDALLEISRTCEAVVLFEAPGRTRETLRELADQTPERSCCVARELTKVHEEMVRGRLSELARDEREWRGEITIVLGEHRLAEEQRSDIEVDERIDLELGHGEHARAIADRVAAWSGRPRREVYARVLERKRRGD